MKERGAFCVLFLLGVLTAAPLARAQAPVTGTYMEPGGRFTLRVPAGWAVKKGFNGDTFYRASAELWLDHDRVMEQETDLEAAVEEYKPAHADAKKLAGGELEIAGQRAFYEVWSAKSKQGVEFIKRATAVRVAGRTQIFLTTLDPKDWVELRGSIEALEKSFTPQKSPLDELRQSSRKEQSAGRRENPPPAQTPPSANKAANGAATTAAGRNATASGFKLVKYESKDPAVVLYKPEKWTVTPTRSATSLHLKVAAPEGLARVETYFADNRSTHFNSLSLMQTLSQQMKKAYSDLKLSEVMVCKDPAISCAVATISYTDGSAPVKGRYFFHADANQAVIRSYQAPEAELNAQRLLLLDILANIHVMKSASGGSATPAPAPLNVQFTQRRATDGSWTVRLPADWNFVGQSGKVIAGAPGGGAGFLFTTFDVMPQRYRLATPPNVIVSPYKPPADILKIIWEKFNNREIQIKGNKPDPQTANGCPGQIGRRCEAADVTLNWVSPKGVSCAGSIKVISALPSFTGQWFTIVTGIWGPSNDLERYMPVLEQVTGSFSISNGYAKSYIEQGLVHLRELQAQTQHSIQGLYNAIDDNQRAYEQRAARKDRSDAGWDDYNRGNSYWISDLEGGKVYATDPWGTKDTTTGDRVEGAPYDYINFEGQNPRYSSEYMREVNSYDVEHMTGSKP